MYPQLGHAIVLSVDPVARTLSVVLPSAQGISTVRAPYYGPADGLRVRQGPLPRPGTTGLCAWPYGDSRNGVWICSLYSGQQDATQPGDPHADYDSHWSGYWHLLDQSGQAFTSYPDGSYVTLSDEPGLPAVTRHIVDQNQKRQAVPVAATDRLASPPSPRPYRFHHGSGTQVDIDASGNTSVAVQPGQTLRIAAGGTTITVAASGAVSILLASGETLGVGTGAFSDFLVLASKLVAAFNTHTHTENGAGPPSRLLAEGDVNSTVIQVSS